MGGVSSFGYSGTIAHALLQSTSSEAAASAVGGGAVLRFRRRAFLWSEPAHPLLQRRLPAPSGCAALFRSPVAGPLHALVADHVVRRGSVGRGRWCGAPFPSSCLLVGYCGTGCA